MLTVRKGAFGERDEDRQWVLGIALSCAVPLWIDVVRHLTPEQRTARAAELARIISIGEKHDEVRGQHGAGPAILANGALAQGADVGGPAAVFNAMAEGFALGAFLPGGVTYLGIHWEVESGEVGSGRR